MAWTAAIPGEGWSSPVVAGDQLWMTTSVRTGKSLRAICVDRNTGKLLHNVEVFAVNQPGKIHEKNTHASPTPVIDGERVFVHFGAHGTAALDRDGKLLWKREFPYYHHHGPAASPVRSGDVLAVACDGFIEPFYDKLVREGVHDLQFLVALDPRTGDVVWKRPRAGRHSYSTPLAITVGGTLQLISPGGDRVIAYDPATGAEIWWCRYTGYSVTPRPVYGGGLVIVCTGYDNPTVLAIRPGGAGDVTGTHVAWKLDRGAPLSASPLIVGGDLYLLADAGILTCVELATGSVRWRERLGGSFSASPLYGDGRVYLLNEEGVARVIEASGPFKELAVNRLPGRTLASPAVSGRSLFVRTDHRLYCIETAVPDD
jgi:outer membrane protein assembly factor BamB